MTTFHREEFKRSQLELFARHRDNLRLTPHLLWLFFEITNCCNLNCRHCGSNCSSKGQFLTICDIEKTLTTIHHDKPMICLTGGEPLLHPHFFEIAKYIKESGFLWGLTTNATLINEEIALKLREAGMSTVSVSIDGMEQAHDSLRQRKGSWNLALRGLSALQEAGFKPQVTTVVHQNNIEDLEPLYEMLREMNIRSWQLINVEPIGRACESGDLLSPAQFAQLLSYIRNKRFDQSCTMEVKFGCSHYLGTDYERMVRDHYFLCGAGILVASIRSNGDICACLDIVNRKDLVQGNIREDCFMDVWLDRFHVFRRDRTSDCSRCLECPERPLCGGDSAHTWDYEKKEPMFCHLDCKRSIVRTSSE